MLSACLDSRAQAYLSSSSRGRLRSYAPKHSTTPFNTRKNSFEAQEDFATAQPQQPCDFVKCMGGAPKAGTSFQKHQGLDRRS